jgi:hypothetical protein
MDDKISHKQMAIRDPKFVGTPAPVKPSPGRPKGSKNKMGRDLMELVMQAAENVGFVERDANNHWVGTRKVARARFLVAISVSASDGPRVPVDVADPECPFQNFLSRLNHLCDFKESHLIRGETDGR